MAGHSLAATPRLRLDKVAWRLMQDVRDAMLGSVPDNLCVIFAVTAPIRQRAATTEALVGVIRERLLLKSRGEHIEMFYGNKVRVRIVARRVQNAASVVGFVHSSTPSPDAMLDAAQLLLGSELGSQDVCAAIDHSELHYIMRQLFNYGGQS